MKKIYYLFTYLFIFYMNFLCHAGISTPLPGFDIKPYLLDITQNSAKIAFSFTNPAPAIVKIHSQNGIVTVNSNTPSEFHSVDISGLQPGKIYKYEVIAADSAVRTPEDDEYAFQTACRPGESFSFVVYGDPRPGATVTNKNHIDVIEQASLQKPAFALVLGDMVDDGSKTENWEEFFAIESELIKSAAIFPVLGDNDFSNGNGQYVEYFPNLEKGYYKFQWGGVHFFALNAWDTKGIQPKSEFDEESDQVKWLIRELSKPEVQEAPFRVIFMHDPVYISRGRSSDLLKKVLPPIFKKYNVNAVFSSWHLYERLNLNSTAYIISGGAGAELIWSAKNPAYQSQAEARKHHFCRVDVNSGLMTIRIIGLDGTVLDSFRISPGGKRLGKTDDLKRLAQRLKKKEFVVNNKNNLDELKVYLFSYDCAYCRRLINKIIPDLAVKNNIRIRVIYFDFRREGTYNLFLNAGEAFGRQEADIPVLLMGKTVFGGENEIADIFNTEILKFKQNPKLYTKNQINPFEKKYDIEKRKESIFNSMHLGLIIGGGFLDGINPCAFTTIIFLLSYLSLAGLSRKQMIFTGISYTLGVFLSYFLVGIIFFNILHLLVRDRTISSIFNTIMLTAVTTLAVFSFIDFYKCLKGKAKDMTLQLPDVLKNKIREKIRIFAKNKIAVLSSSFVLGCVIAGMELACTGQVYIPIVSMISRPEYRVKALSYLFVYNVAFIIPLIAVFALVILGVTSKQITSLFQKHIAIVKLAFALLFVAMGILILYNTGWI